MATPPGLTLSHPAAFIGRGRQLAEVSGWLRTARGGVPTVVLIEGDLGIGKSRFARELGRRAVSLGFQVCSGQCDEYPSRPFNALAASLLPRIVQSNAIAGPGVSDYGASVIQRLAGLSPGAAGALESGDGALMQALPSATRALATQQPLLVVIDDLHWADGDTLSVLRNLALTFAESGHDSSAICLLALYRPVAPDSPVGRTLDRMRREPFVRRLMLPGLDELELNELVREASATNCSPALLAALQRAGHGNPLFALTALDGLLERGDLRAVGGQLRSGMEPADLRLPAEATQAVELRLGQASDELQAQLRLLSLLPEAFNLRDVAIAAGTTEATAEQDLQEAVRRRFVVERDDDFQFAHPTYRHALRESLSAGQRRRMHARIAERLVALGESAPANVLDVAYHLVEAGAAADQATIGAWCLRAARTAFAANAWGESARYYDAALAATAWYERLLPTECAAVERDCGLAKGMNADSAGARRHFLIAAHMARQHSESELWGEALIGWAKSYTTLGARVPDSSELEAFMDSALDASPSVSARLLAVWAEALWLGADPNDLAVAERALAAARTGADALAIVNAAVALGICRLRRVDLHGAIEAFEIGSTFAERSPYRSVQAAGPTRISATRLLMGNLAAAEAAAADVESLTRGASDWGQLTTALATSAACMTLRADLDRAEELAVEATLCLSRSGYRPASGQVFGSLAWLRFLGGNHVSARDALDLWSAWGSRSAVAWTTAFLEAARASSPVFPGDLPAPWRRDIDVARLGSAALVVHTARLAGVALPAEFPIEHFAVAHASGAQFTQFPPLSLLRVLGVAHGLTGDLVEADRVLTAALHECLACGAFAEATLARIDLAWLQLKRGDFPAAAAEAAAAIEEYGLWGARDLLDKTLAAHGLALGPSGRPARLPDGLRLDEMHVLRGVVRGRTVEQLAYELALSEPTVAQLLASGMAKARAESPEQAAAYLDGWGIEVRGGEVPGEPLPAGTLARKTFLFTDIDDSTPLNQLLGDERYFALLQRHNAVIEQGIRAHAGAVLKHTGDGYFASFVEAADALACSIELAGRFPLTLPGAPGAAMRIAMGIHIGDAVLTENDAFGLAVATASRICGIAAGGEVLVSEEIRQLAAGGGVTFIDRGRLPLKGLVHATRVYELRPADAGARMVDSGLPRAPHT